VYYEHTLRPEEKRHAPWLDRVTGQLHEAFGALETALAREALPAPDTRIDQAGITTAVAWTFTQETIPGVVPTDRHPLLAAYTARAEALPAFRAAAHGFGTCPTA
jgi:glutathione S-transferase